MARKARKEEWEVAFEVGLTGESSESSANSYKIFSDYVKPAKVDYLLDLAKIIYSRERNNPSSRIHKYGIAQEKVIEEYPCITATTHPDILKAIATVYSQHSFA